MIIKTKKCAGTYTRIRFGKQEQCNNSYTMYFLRCDECGFEFTRTSKQFNTRSAAHVCGNCNQKQFAQKQSSVLRQYNKWDASSSKTI